MGRTKKRKAKDAAALGIKPETDGGFARLKRKNTVRHVRQRVFYFVLLIVLAAVFLCGAVAIFFRVSSVSVQGNDMYSDEDIKAASGIQDGMNIYLIDDTSVRANILSAFPFVKTVKLTRNVPSGITLLLQCDEPGYYVEINGEFFIVSDDLRVLERMWTKEAVKEKYPKIKKLTAGSIKRAVVGSELAFVNENYSDVGVQLLKVLAASEINEGVTSVDFSDRFNIYVVYDSRLKANLGNTDDIDLKLRFMNEIVKDLGQARGTIDIKDVETGYALLNSTEVYD